MRSSCKISPRRRIGAWRAGYARANLAGARRSDMTWSGRLTAQGSRYVASGRLTRARPQTSAVFLRSSLRGRSPRSIAHTLNAESVTGLKGRSWQDTTIRGHATRRTGILRNDLYRGQLIWNKQPRYHRADQRHPLGAGLLRDRSHRRYCQHDRVCRERCPN